MKSKLELVNYLTRENIKCHSKHYGNCLTIDLTSCSRAQSQTLISLNNGEHLIIKEKESKLLVLMDTNKDKLKVYKDLFILNLCKIWKNKFNLKNKK